MLGWFSAATAWTSRSKRSVKRCWRDLDGDVAPQARIVGAIHFAHSAGADGREDFVRPEFVANRKRHLNDSASKTNRNQ